MFFQINEENMRYIYFLDAAKEELDLFCYQTLAMIKSFKIFLVLLLLIYDINSNIFLKV